MKKILLSFLLIASCTIIKAQNEYVILVSFDGFRWDYCSKAETPVFDSVAKNGVKAESLQPSFPTKTFPNHYTLVTGLYPDHHGIINNSFYSPEHQAIYQISDRKKVADGSYYSGKPIWNLAEENGIKTASFFWVGSEADIDNKKASHWKAYEHNFPFEQRIDSVISWLRLPESQRPRLILLYFHEPDSKGHKYGPDSEEIKELIPEIDHLLGNLFRKINSLEIKESINVIICSDHGMGNVSKERVVYLDKFLKKEWIDRIVGANPVYNIWAKENFEDSLVNSLKKIEHTKCWKNRDVPARLHYGNNPRTGDFTLVADSSWSIELKKVTGLYSKGAHGYDNQNKDMHAIFYAIGPAFKTNFLCSTIKNIDIYPLIGHILGIQIPEIDGQFDRIRPILNE